MSNHRFAAVFAVLLVALAAAPVLADPGERVRVTADSDARAIEIAQSVVERMGGWEAWDATRFLSWKFFGGRQHYWDRHSGDIRIAGKAGESEWLWLMNVNSRQGRAFKDGTELAGDELAEALETGRKIWVNDSYWLVMPFKLLDPGVTLKYSGERAMADGRSAWVLDLTFGEGIGYTPQNRYEVFVAQDTGLVEQWSFFREASEEEPGFTMPWSGWSDFGRIKLATGRGRDRDWQIAVHDTLPEALFRDPEVTAP